MIARNFFVVCAVVTVFGVLFCYLVNNHHKYGEVRVRHLDESFDCDDTGRAKSSKALEFSLFGF